MFVVTMENCCNVFNSVNSLKFKSCGHIYLPLLAIILMSLGHLDQQSAYFFLNNSYNFSLSAFSKSL